MTSVISSPSNVTYLQDHMFVAEILESDFVNWVAQRPLNMETVRRYTEAQRALIQARGHPIILGDFVFSNFMGKNYILDGQHRVAMLRQLRDEGINLNNTKVSVQIIDCITLNDINTLYVMANERYTVNGNISSSGVVYTTSTSAQEVVDRLKLRFNNFNIQENEH